MPFAGEIGRRSAKFILLITRNCSTTGVGSGCPPNGSRVVEWHGRIRNTSFLCADYRETFTLAKSGDLIYCDPPYSFSQAILYGAQSFDLIELLESVEAAKKRGVYVALSIDGNKKSGDFLCDLPIPPGLFTREYSVNVGRSMLKRFQMEGKTLEKEIVSDRLLLTY